MCSRYCLTSPAKALREHFGYPTPAAFPPRYNIAPTQPVGIVRHDHSRQREFALVRWGLIPSWTKDPGKFKSMVNARAETASVKPSFRGSLRHRRCLVPADGYYEWTGPAGTRRPYMIRPRTGGPIAFAGLWEHWLGADGSEIETMAILTIAANAVIGQMHERMPVIIGPGDFEAWLDTRSGSSVDVQRLLMAAGDDLLETVAVSEKVNNVGNDGPDIQFPI